MYKLQELQNIGGRLWCLLILVPCLAVAQTYWVGTTSTAWATASNWSTGVVPSATTDVVIGDSHFTGTYQPSTLANATCKSLTVGGAVTATLTISSRLYCSGTGNTGNVTINSNGTITHSGAVDLRVNGNWTINTGGTYNATNTSARVYLNGTGTQNVTGITTFQRLYIASGTTVLQNAITVSNLFTVAGGTFDPQTYLVTLNGTRTFSGGTARVRAATFAQNYSANPSTNPTSTIDYNTTANQTISSAISYNNISINGAGSIKSLQANTTIRGNVTVTTGTLDLLSYTANRSTAGGTFSVAAAGYLKLSGVFPTNYTTYTFSTGSTVEYYGSGQSVSARTYSNLLISGSGTATLGGATTSSGTLTINTGSTLAQAANTLTVSGNLVVNGTLSSTTGSITFSGTNKTLDGSGTISTTSTGAINVTAGAKTILATANLTITRTINITATANVTVTNNGMITTSAAGGITSTRTGSGWTNAANSTLNIAGPLLATGTLTATANSNTVNYNGTTTSQPTIKGATYYNLTITKGSQTGTLGANTTVNGTLTVTSGTLSGSTYTLSVAGNIINSGTLTGSTGTIQATGNNTSITGSGTFSFINLTISGTGISLNTSSTVSISGNLTVSGAGFTIPTSYTISVGGNISTTGSGTLTANAGTISMTGTTKTISGSGIIFNDFTVASGSVSTASTFTIAGNFSAIGSFSATTGIITLSGTSKTFTVNTGGSVIFSRLTITGSISTTSSFTISSDLSVSGSFSATSGIITFAGTSTLSGTANLYSVTLNGTKLQLGANSILGIAGSLLISAGTLDLTSTTPNTVNYNGGSQTVTPTTYYNLMMSSGYQTAGGNLSVRGSLTIANATTFDANSSVDTIYGNFINNGALNAGSSNIQLVGSSDASISGTATTIFNTLTINKNSTTNVVSLNSYISTSTVAMTSGTLMTGSYSITITGTRTGNGSIFGVITRTHTFNTGTNYEFESPNNFVNFSSVSGVTAITVTALRTSVSDFPYGASVNREYDVAVSGGTYSATLRLHYENSDLNGSDEAALELWSNTGSAWTDVSETGIDTLNNWVEKSAISSLNGRWSLAALTNVARWTGAVSTDWNDGSNWTIARGSPHRPPDYTDIVVLGDSAFSNQPAISGAFTVKSLGFGSAQAVTLSISSGSLTVNGNIGGTWSSGSATHTLNVGSNSLTVGGSIVQSDGTYDHSINLTSSGSITISGSLTQSGNASIVLNSGTLSIAGDFNYQSGTFNAGLSTVIFNGTGAQSVGGNSVAYKNLTINKVSGTATLLTPATIQGNLTLSASGTFDVNATLSVGGYVFINNGTKLDGSSSTINVGGDWTNNGTFVSDLGSVVMNGSSPQSISASLFNNLTINKSDIATLSGDLQINGDLSITSGTLDLSTHTADRSIFGGTLTIGSSGVLKIGGSGDLPANYAANTIASTSTVEYYGTGAQTITPAAYGNLTLTNGGSTAKSLGGASTINGNLLINSSATLNSATYPINLAGNWTNSGSFIPNSGSVSITGSGSILSGATTFFNLSIPGSCSFASDISIQDLLTITGTCNAGATSLTVTGNMTNTGTFLSSGIISFAGDISNTGTFTTSGTTTLTGAQIQNIAMNSGFTSTGTVNFNGTVAPIFGGSSPPHFTAININNSGGISPVTGWTIGGPFTVQSGKLFNGGALTQTFNSTFTNYGTVTDTGGTLLFNPSGGASITYGTFLTTGTVQFSGSGAISFSGTTPSFNNLVISNTNAGGVAPSSGLWTISGDLTIDTNSIFNASSSSLTLTGNLTNYGTFTGGSSTLTLVDTTTISGTGTTTLNHLTINSASLTAISTNVCIQGNLTNSGTLNTTADIAIQGNLTNSASFTAGSDITIQGNLSNSGTFINDGVTITFTGPSSSSISLTSSYIDQLTISKTNSATVKLLTTIDSLSALMVSSGILDGNGQTISELSGAGTFAINADATFKTGGTTTAFPSFTSYDFNPSSNVEYNGSGNQAISVFPVYGNLTLSTGGTKTAPDTLTIAGDLTLAGATFAPGVLGHSIAGDFSITSGTVSQSNFTLNIGGNYSQSGGTFNGGIISIDGNFSLSTGSFIAGSNADTIGGNWTISGGTFTNTGSTIVFNGSGAQTINSLLQFNILNVNKTSGTLTLSSNVTATTLSFTNGKLTTGSYKMIIPSGGTVSGANASKYVIGNLQKYFDGSHLTQVFEIGDNSTYARDSIVFTSLTASGNLTASTTFGDHPNIITSIINSAKTVNRYWTLTQSGALAGTYSATFNFVPGDIDAGANYNNFFINRYYGGTWDTNITVDVNRTGTSTRAVALTLFGEFQIGEKFTGSLPFWTGHAGDHKWNTPTNWIPANVPTSNDNVNLTNLYGRDTIDIDASANVLTLAINNDTLKLTVLPAGSLSAVGNIIMAKGTFYTQGAFPSASSISFNGGTFGYTASGNQTISPQTYNNLVISGSGTKTTAGRVTIDSNLTITGGILDIRTDTVNRATNGGTLTLASNDTLRIGGSSGGLSSSNFPNNFSAITLNGTVEYSGSGSQIVSVLSYKNLRFSGNGTKTLAGNISPTGDINITAGTFDLSTYAANLSGTLTVAQGATLRVGGGSGGLPGSNLPTSFAQSLLGTIEFSGTSAQTVPVFNYNNLTLSNSTSVTLANTDTIRIAGVFTTNGATYITTGSTINFNGTSPQTIPPINYDNIRVSNSGPMTLASGTVGIAGFFSPGSSTYTTTGSTVNFNGSSYQTIPQLNYNNLTISGSQGAALGGSITLTGDLTIISGTFDLGTFTANRTASGGALLLATGTTMKVSGSSGGLGNSNFPNNFSTTLLGTVEFSGTSSQTIPALTYTNLTLSNSGQKIIDNDITGIGNWNSGLNTNITITSGKNIQVNNTFTNYGTITNGGTIQVGTN